MSNVVPARSVRPQQLQVPPGVSKSMAKALGCGHHFVYQYLAMRNLRTRGVSNALTQAGIQFHAYRAHYVNHLVETGQPRDLNWVERYLERPDILPDVAWLIRRQDAKFKVNPDSVYGAEVFLSCNEQLQPLEIIVDNPTPGMLSGYADAFASATIDLLCIEGERATVIDAKSGFSTVGVTDDEPPINALVVFAHFPMVKTVEFRWDFVRNKVNRRATYTRRDDLDWMMGRVRALNERKWQLVEAYNRGARLDTNAFAGLCTYCVLHCPLRPKVEDGTLAVAPPQTEEDRRRLVTMVHVCEQFLAQARPLLRPAIDAAGPIRLNEEWVYAPQVTESSSYTLPEALSVLGLALIPAEAQIYDAEGNPVEIPPLPSSPRFDVPLNTLTVSAGKLNSYAGTKKSKRGVSREGLAELLDGVGKRYPKTTLRFRRESADDTIQRLEASLAQIEEDQTEGE